MSQTTQITIPGPSALADPSRTSLLGQQQNIPRFLLKLYEIVNDPANEALVKWSDAGDSFYILNHERFAREILGKWFKHQNFSSFVRQLNLYGFRKIAALQQGLLRTDGDSEAVQFAHPNFHRGQPNLLGLIQRRRNPQPHNDMDDGTVGLLQASLSQDSQGQGQAVDVRSIVEGINAIRRQQEAIATELSALKQSNDDLWKEAIEARERHTKHERTINRILEFLAGMFGRVIRGHGGVQSNGGGKAARLLIGDGRANHGEGMDFESDTDTHSEPGSRGPSPFPIASERFATIETPNEPPTPATTAEVHDPAPKPPLKPLQSIPDVQTEQNAPASLVLPPTTVTSTPPVGQAIVPNSIVPNPAAMWQATLQQMLTSPAHFQQVLQTFASPTPTPSASPTIPVPVPSILAPPYLSQQQQQQQQPWTYPYSVATSAPQANPSNPLTIPPPPPPAMSVDPTPQVTPFLDPTDPLTQANRDATEIRATVDDRQTNLQADLQALIYNMGLDPQNMTFPTVDHPNVPAPSAGVNDIGQGQDGCDFSLDSWLNEFGGAAFPDFGYSASLGQPAQDGGEEDFSAFLDIPALDGASSSPGTTALSSPTGMKRKIEAVEVPEVQAGDEPLSKKKR